MAFNSGGDFKSVYGSPILSSHNFINNSICGGGSLFDSHPHNRDWSRSSNLKNYGGGDSSLVSNYNNAGRLNFDKFNWQSDRFASNNYLNGYSSNYLPRDGLLNGNMKSDSLFKSDSQFEIPSYLKSVDTYSPSRLNYNAGNQSNNHCTPTRFFNAGTRPNGLAGASNQNYNFHASKFNSSSSNYDAGGSNLLRSSLNDDWKRNNYLKVSNSPNLKFSSHFFPNNSRALAERRKNYGEMNDYLHYAKSRDKLDKIGRNLNSLSPPGVRNFDSKHSGNYSSNFDSSIPLDNLDKFDSVLNGNFNSLSYVNPSSRFLNRPDSYSRHRGSDSYRKFDDSETYNRYKPSESYGAFNRPDAFSRFSGTQPYGRYSAPEHLDKFTGLDKYNKSNPLDSSLNNSYFSSINRYVDAQETASPSFAFSSDLADLNIDDLYDKVKEQKQQLLKLKSDFH